MKRRTKFGRLLALMMALAMLLSSMGAALSEAVAVEESLSEEAVIVGTEEAEAPEDATEEAAPVEEAAETIEEAPEEIEALPEAEVAPEAADEDAQEAPDESAEEPSTEVEPPIVAETDAEGEAEAEPSAAEASLAVSVEIDAGAVLRATIRAEGLLIAPSYRWQSVEKAAYAEAVQSGAELETLWADVEGANGETLDAAAAMGDRYEDYSYRCIAQSGEVVAISDACSFPEAGEAVAEEVAEEVADAETPAEDAPVELPEESADVISPDVIKDNCEHDFQDYREEIVEDVLEATDETHTVTVWVVTGKQCSQCNFFQEYNISRETELKEDVPHTFDNGVCTVCKMKCRHTNATAREWKPLPLSGSYDRMAISATQHVNCEKRREYVTCADCGATVEKAVSGPDRINIVGDPVDHTFDSNGRCTGCLYQQACSKSEEGQHDFDFNGVNGKDVGIVDYYDRYEPSEDGTKCIGIGRTRKLTAFCKNCRTAMVQITYDANARDELEHDCEDGNYGMCKNCNRAKVCTHEHVMEFEDRVTSADMNSRDVILYGGEVRYNGDETGIETHTGKVVRTYYVECEDCKAVWSREEVVEVTERCRPNRSDTSKLGVCTVCGHHGSQNTPECYHAQDKREYLEFYEVEEAVVDPNDPNRHIVTDGLLAFRCKACGIVMPDYNATTPDKISELLGKKISLPHELDQNGRCRFCDAVIKCDHSFSTSAKYDGHIPEDGGYTRKDMKTHYHLFTGEYKICEKCGAIVSVGTGVWTGKTLWSTIEEPHTWLDDGTCAYCLERRIECDHSNEELNRYLRTYQRYIDDPDDTEQHTQRDVKVYRCLNCKTEFEREDESSDVRVNHVFGEDGICTLCGHSNAYTKLTFASEKIQLAVGDKVFCGLTTQPKVGVGTIAFKSDNEKVAKVDSEGMITAVATGTATITASCDALKATMTVQVAKNPAKIALNACDLTLGLEEEFTLAAKLPEGETGEISWASDNEDVATVQGGKVTAVAIGKTVISARVSEALTAYCRVTVKPAPNGQNMSLSLAAEKLLVNSTVRASVKYNDAAGAYSFASSMPEVATVNEKTGEVKGIAPGTTQISATAYNGTKVTRQIRILPVPTKVTITNNPKKLGRYEDNWQIGAKLTAVVDGKEVESMGTVTFKSSNTRVLAVNKNNGKLTPKGLGSAKITATSHNGKKASVTITVKKAPTKFKLKKHTITMAVGEPNVKEPEAVFGSKSEYCHVHWIDQYETIVKVVDGTFVARRVGTTSLMCCVYWGGQNDKPFFDDCKVVIKNPPVAAKMHLGLKKLVIGVGESVQASFKYDDDVAGAYTYSSADKTIASVNSKGLVTGQSVGITTIRVKAFNGETVEEQIEVVPKPTKISLTNKVTKMGIGEIWQLGAKVTSDKTDITDKMHYSFKSSKSSVVKVLDANTGKLQAKRTGKATITVSTYNGKKASVTITVKNAPKSIKLMKGKTTLAAGAKAGTCGVGEKVTLSVKYNSTTSFGNVTWTSSDNEIAKVSKGVVTAGSKLGTAEITASVYNSKDADNPLTAKCQVEVRAEPTEENAQLAPKKLQIGVGESTATSIESAEAAGAVKSYKSSSTKIATVSTKGVIKGVKTGKVTITATMYNGVKLTKQIQVVKAPTSLSITNLPEKNTLAVGETWTPEFKIGGYTGEDTSGVVKTFTSSSTKKASFKGGVLTAKAVGTTKITCKTYNGKASKTVTIRIVAATEP